MPKLSVQIVTYNSLKFLEDCLESLLNQTFKDFQVLVIDNYSTDGTLNFLKEKYPGIFIFRNSKNVGFAKAHNQGFTLINGDYILVLNPDVILEPNFLEKLLAAAEKKKAGFSFGGKLLKIKTGNQELGKKIKTKIIDSTGLKIYSWGQFRDRGEGEEDKGQYDKKKDVFGISGACVLYRRKFLKEIGFFDEDFFAYKEDVDLSWRAQLFGFSSFYVPEAVAYHYRQAPKERRLSQTPLISFYSFRNGLFLILKNAHWQNIILYSPLIFAYLLIKKIYLLFTQPKICLRAKISFILNFSKMYKKRERIFSARGGSATGGKRIKITAKQFRKKFFSHS